MAAGERLRADPCVGSPVGIGLFCLSHSEEGVTGPNGSLRRRHRSFSLSLLFFSGSVPLSPFVVRQGGRTISQYAFLNNRDNLLDGCETGSRQWPYLFESIEKAYPHP